MKIKVMCMISNLRTSHTWWSLI